MGGLNVHSDRSVAILGALGLANARALGLINVGIGLAAWGSPLYRNGFLAADANGINSIQYDCSKLIT